jgi:hypothetical protein
MEGESMMRPVVLEVVAPMLATTEMSCRGCGTIMGVVGLKSEHRRSSAEEYPEDWKDAASHLSKWISEISLMYRHRILIRVIDAQSPMGMWKQIRYRVFKFPAFIVNKKKAYVGWDPQALESLIDGEVRTTL